MDPVSRWQKPWPIGELKATIVRFKSWPLLKRVGIFQNEVSDEQQTSQPANKKLNLPVKGICDIKKSQPQSKGRGLLQRLTSEPRCDVASRAGRAGERHRAPLVPYSISDSSVTNSTFEEEEFE